MSIPIPSAADINEDPRKRAVTHVVFFVLFLLAWETYGRTGNALILPPFTQVITAFWDLLVSGRLMEALLPSLQLLAMGFALGISAAMV
ncbi:MAG: hypothetical protein ACOC9Y_07245, partial [Chloroflexota bacterium]